MTESHAQVAAQTLAQSIVAGMQDKKGMEIVLLDLRAIPHAVADFFVICSGNSDTQVDALKDAVEEATRKQCGEGPWRMEGIQQREWIVLDYVNVVAHIFKKDKRGHYRLEELWGDAPQTKFAD